MSEYNPIEFAREKISGSYGSQASVVTDAAIISGMVENERLRRENARLRNALESHVRGLDKMRHLIGEGRDASGKLEDIRTAIIYERVNAVAALQEANDE